MNRRFLVNSIIETPIPSPEDQSQRQVWENVVRFQGRVAKQILDEISNRKLLSSDGHKFASLDDEDLRKAVSQANQTHQSNPPLELVLPETQNQQDELFMFNVMLGPICLLTIPAQIDTR